MKDCLTKQIGIKGSCVEPKIHNIDSIGITLSELNQYHLDHFANGEELFENKKEFAWHEMSAMITAHLSKFLTGDETTENGSIGYYLENQNDLQPILGKYVGIQIENCVEGSPLKLFISRLKLEVDHVGSVDVLVFDGNTRKQIDTITITANDEDFINKIFDVNYQSLNVILVYESIYTSTPLYVRKGHCTKCVHTQGYDMCSKHIRARGIQANVSDGKISNIKYKDHTYGFTADYSVQCDYELWLCGFSNKLIIPLMYLTGANLMQYSIESAGKVRNNNSVIDVEVNRQRYDGMMMKFHEHLNLVIKSIKVPNNDTFCFNCKQPLIYT
jgi:hypothetical protein